MMRASTFLTILSLVSTVVSVDQAAFSSPNRGKSRTATKGKSKRELKGRFLHITDFHPDEHYKVGSTIESACHRKPGKDGDSGKDKDKKGKGKARLEEDAGLVLDDGLRDKEALAGIWGAGISDCDSPMSLINMTFAWLKENWAEEVDFVVWTGDNARHDIDRSLPRTPKEIFTTNRMLVEKFIDTFPPDIPIVPSIGNNDIYPHNVLAAGPSTITSEYLRIWSEFIPPDYGHVFERGAYYAQEVIPDRLAVISLNTLFWYDSNTLVDGCKDRSNDPGALEMDWLEVQLQMFRDRGMQVWLTGHVPPHLGIYYENCYLRYGDLSLRFQDTIVGHLYGHMNIDHFFFIDVEELEAANTLSTKHVQFRPHDSSHSSFDILNSTLPPLFSSYDSSNAFNSALLDSDEQGTSPRNGPTLLNSGRMQIMGRNGNRALVDALKKDFGEMPGPAKMKMKDYVVINVSPSVIPTYLPGIRIFSYNISGVSLNPQENDLDPAYSPALNAEDSDDDDLERKHGHRHQNKKKKKKKDDCTLPENEDKPHCTFRRKPRYQSKTSPSRSNQPLTPLGYAQWFLPDVDSSSKEPPKWELEYTTYKIRDLLPGNDTAADQPPRVPLDMIPGFDPAFFRNAESEELERWIDEVDEEEPEEEGWLMIPEEVAEAKGGNSVEERRKAWLKELKKKTPWKMKDLTIPSYVHLARKLVAEKKLWRQFSKFMFVSSGAT